MKAKATKDNAPEFGDAGPEDIAEVFKALFGADHATPRSIVVETIARLDATTPPGVDYRAHLIEASLERGHVAGMVPDQLTALAFRAFADALEFALKGAGQWKDDYIVPDRPEGTENPDEASKELRD